MPPIVRLLVAISVLPVLGLHPGRLAAQGAEVYTETQLDSLKGDRPERLSCTPDPGAPREEPLRRGGTVSVQFIVGLEGRIEPETVAFLEPRRPDLESRARRLLLACLYRPGRLAGKPVRVRVDMQVEFHP
jgi:hypothetical protein